MYAEKAPMKYGKVDKSDLDMKVYAADTSASAVILCNYGYFDANDFKFVHQMRIKILKEEGKHWGNFVTPASEGANVKGQVVNIENGVPVVTKLGKESIFVEKLNKNNYQARVAFPNVKVGSVLDVEFYFSGLPSSWDFQETIPLKWSELIIEDNSNLTFRKNSIGYTPFFVSERDRWVTKDVPAFKSEPYVNNSKNYMSRFDIEVSSIHVPGLLYREFATSWEAVAETLSKETNFGLELSTFHLYLNDIANQIKKETTSPEERLNRAFQEIKKIKWNKKSSVWISESGLSSSFNKKIGNSADINLNLVLLLRKLDINANPIVLSTRENGTLPAFSVSINKLNYVAVRAKIADKTILLDATEEYLPVGLLPKRALNGKGLVVINDKYEWIELDPVRKDKSIQILNLKLTPEGALKGTWNISKCDYAAVDQRVKYKSFNSQDDYLKSIESKYVGLTIDNCLFNNFDSIQKPINGNFDITLKNKVTKANNQYFIQPILFDKWSENPFKQETRIFPIDFITPIENMQLLNLEIPEGFVVEQLPKNVKVGLAENTASFQMQSTVMDNRIVIQFKTLINKPIFYVTEYLDLKAYFDELVKTESEMLILKKI
jgi:hypothetical protein